MAKATETTVSTSKSVTAECPTGKHVVGGGFKVILGTADPTPATESIPFLGSGGKRTGWTVAGDTADPGTWGIEAVAICAEF